MTHPADDQLLEQFRRWLDETRSATAVLTVEESVAIGPDTETPAVGLYRFAEEFTALRQEVKLQTRSSRGLEEISQSLLDGLRQATDALRSIEPKEAQAAWSAGKGLALALAEIDESLERGRQQLERVVLQMEQPEESLRADLERIQREQSPWRRWFCRRYHVQVLDLLESSPIRSQQCNFFSALIDGYALIQQRLSRLLAAEGIVRIATVGQDVDPEQMIVLEVVQAAGSSGMVVEEIRKGYTWNGRLLRCAEVRATKDF